MSVELRSVVLRYSSTSFSLASSICPESHCSSPANLLICSCEDSSRTERPIVVLGMVPSALCQRLEGTALGHPFLKSSTKRWRRIRRICPKLLDHDVCHSDLFLLSLSMSLQGRHPCFQSGDPVDELLILLLCQTHSCHGWNHNNSSRKVQGSGCSATIMR